jgi:hypothetical protein
MRDSVQEPPPLDLSSTSSGAAARKTRSEALAAGGLAALLVYSVVRSLVAAASRPFWYDELCTWFIVRLGSAHAIWQALKNAADGQPPLFYLIEQFFSKLTSNEEIGFRVASILGFLCVLLCIFVFVRGRSNGAYALLCSSLLLLTVLYSTYAVEARPSSLVVACFALALICYQHAPDAPWMIPMGLALALAENLHYYAVFALVPFGAAEIAVYVKTRRIRASVWLALLCGCLPLLWLFPQLRVLKTDYGKHIWAVPTLYKAFGTFGWIFNFPHNGKVVIADLLILTGIMAFLALVISRRLRNAWISEPLFHEHILALGFLALPFIGYAVTKITGGGLTDHHIIPVVLGVPLAGCYLVPRMGHKGLAVFVMIVIVIAGAKEARFWISQDHHVGELESPAIPVENAISAVGYPDLPVVISAALQYVPVEHYASTPWKNRFVLLVDPLKSVIYEGNGSDNADVQMLILRSYAPLHVELFSSFRVSNPEFLLLSNGEPAIDWWPDRFKGERDGELRVLRVQGRWKIYLVKVKS